MRQLHDPLPPVELDALAEALAHRLAPRLRDAQIPDAWLNTADAAAYLGLTVTALHKLTSARSVPFSQDCPGGKCWFQRSALDEWRRERK